MNKSTYPYSDVYVAVSAWKDSPANRDSGLWASKQRLAIYVLLLGIVMTLVGITPVSTSIRKFNDISALPGCGGKFRRALNGLWVEGHKDGRWTWSTEVDGFNNDVSEEFFWPRHSASRLEYENQAMWKLVDFGPKLQLDSIRKAFINLCGRHCEMQLSPAIWENSCPVNKGQCRNGLECYMCYFKFVCYCHYRKIESFLWGQWQWSFPIWRPLKNHGDGSGLGAKGR